MAGHPAHGDQRPAAAGHRAVRGDGAEVPAGQGEHRLTGARIPDLTLQGYDGDTYTVFQLLRRRRFVLLDQTSSGRCAERVRSGWGDRVVAVNALASGEGGWQRPC
ncbi:hypothetical protein ACFQXA_09120 [Nocardiopsis composta]